MNRVAQLLDKIELLNNENQELQKRLLVANENLHAIKTGNIDALVVAHKKTLTIYTEQKADNTYRILIEKMHEGAVTLNKDGIILYCNSAFANLVCLPLQKVIGTKFINFIDDPSKDSCKDLFKKGWQAYAQNELYLLTEEAKTIPVMMSVNTLSFENNFVLGLILTDLTLQKTRAEFKSTLIEKIIKVIIEMNDSNEFPKINNSRYISRKLNYNYTYLANVFSEVKGITIQQFIIIQKIEKVKEMLNAGFTLTEIAYNLHYSSVSYLSMQFKNVTGFSPSLYKQIKQKNSQKRA